jgi:hypothetical protein
MTKLLVAEVCKGARVSRRDGEALRGLLESHWNDSEPVVLDFEGVVIASVSFFDESFGALALRHPLSELTRRIKVEHMQPEDRKLLNTLVLARERESRAHGTQGDDPAPSPDPSPRADAHRFMAGDWNVLSPQAEVTVPLGFQPFGGHLSFESSDGDLANVLVTDFQIANRHMVGGAGVPAKGFAEPFGGGTVVTARLKNLGDAGKRVRPVIRAR